ncbi:MAG: 16S rRNA (cytosine(967)-C(5))-methyltransferase RsmB [Lachnospiraceae bacterium]|nr:16S rRNA (cytosine(967)-C(5))-methyltransferase RsmB [Lachnospiraceae bacterium]
MNLRLIVLEILLIIDKDGISSDRVIRQVLNKYDYLENQEKRFIKRLSEGCLERRTELDYIIDKFSKTKTVTMKPQILEILRMGVYQLKYMDSVPESAVCNEAVKLATQKGFTPLKGFVNGVLRSIARNIEDIEYPDEDTYEGLSVKYSCPQWICKQLMCEQGPYNTHKILEESLKPPGIFVRTNLSRIGTDRLVERLKDEDISSERAPYLDYALRLTNIDSVERIESFLVGLFQIQDIGSMLVTQVSGIKPGDTVMDVCAAPGGKSLHALDRLNGKGHLYAFDISEKKLEMIRENAARGGYCNLEVKQADATVYLEEYEEKADVLIADLPCSGLGVMGRKNDIKYNMTPQKEESLVKLQRDILSNVSHYVKPGGTLIFSTCTIHKAENEDNVKWITENLPFETVSLDEFLPEELRCETSSKGYIQLIPGVHKCDGFFISGFKKKYE